MEQTKYLVVGSSHAALEALTAIRMHDAEGSLTLLTRDLHLPYSPTVLPYVVSGRSAADNVFLRDENFFAEQKISLKRGKALKTLHASRNTAELADGSEIGYEKLLLATGASPAIPPIPGIDQVSYHVLRTLDDATKLNAAMKASKQAVVMGAGLVGMHAAENLVKAGAKVTIVEMAKQLTDGYFDATAAALIEKAFTDNGATILTGSRVVKLAPSAHLPPRVPRSRWKAAPRWRPTCCWWPPACARTWISSWARGRRWSATRASWSANACRPACRTSSPPAIAPRRRASIPTAG
jgi:phenylglyoxylate dehydrogenase epsilon subunit